MKTSGSIEKEIFVLEIKIIENKKKVKIFFI
jgi:hypothetical protein